MNSINESDWTFLSLVKVWGDDCQHNLEYNPDLTDDEIHQLLIERDLAFTIAYDLLIDLTLNHISYERS